MVRRAMTTVALAVLALLLASAPASADLRWRGCPEATGVRCAKLRVPLDRSGGLPGSVDLRVARVRLSDKRDPPYLMYLSGGPGGAGVVEMIDVLLELPQLARRFTVLGFDQRGTGRSGLLRCRAVERDERLRSTRAGERCARRLGARRSFYTTPDSVEDMEALRRAAGAPKLTLMGISYGTELALAYARRYPEHVERLILDSVVDPDDGDPFGLAGFRAMGPTLRALCPDGCRGVTTDPVADLVALTARLRAAPLRGAWYDGRGRRHRGAVTPVKIADLLYDADYNPALRTGVPVAVRAALAGDAAPLLRLISLSPAFPSAPRDFSAARYAAVCEETPLPWPRGTPLDQRFAVARAAALALPPAAFWPFDAEVAYADEIDLCLRWPDPARPPAPKGGAYPAVPALLLQGEEDIRTPPEVSARIAGLIPGRAAGDRAGRRPRGRGRRLQRLRPAPDRPLPRRRPGPGALPARRHRRSCERGAADLVPRARAGAGPVRARGPHGARRRRDARVPRAGRRAGARSRRPRRRAARRPLPLRAAADARGRRGRARRPDQRPRGPRRHAAAAGDRLLRGARADPGHGPRPAAWPARRAAGARPARAPPAASARLRDDVRAGGDGLAATRAAVARR